MGCFPCNNLQPEVAHLNACYPPFKTILNSGPEFRPLSQDLSKLTYFATNKPSKLAKIGEELEKRIEKESSKSTNGYLKYRASLLISLSILRALLIECKRDISLFYKSTLNSIKFALNVKVYQSSSSSATNNNNEKLGGSSSSNDLGLDLEVIERALSAFTAFTTFTDGNLIGLDEGGTTKIYLDILRKFTSMAYYIDSKKDIEQQNRTRLIGLAGLNGSILSDSLYNSSNSKDFQNQINIILPPILINLFDNSIEELKQQTLKIEDDHNTSNKDKSSSPFFQEFNSNQQAKRPINDRRAPPSIHSHIIGEKGPTTKDVLIKCLKSFNFLIQQLKVTQINIVIESIISFLDKTKNWNQKEKCQWLIEDLTSHIILQYRSIVPTKLIEILIHITDSNITQDSSSFSADQSQIVNTTTLEKKSTLLSMISTILNSTISLVGLGVSDLLGNLITLIIRRIKLDERDSLLPLLVSCISSLGTHIYYSDQINDIIEEISIRIAEIDNKDKDRSEIIRVLINCIVGVMLTADSNDQKQQYNNGGTGAHTKMIKMQDIGNNETITDILRKGSISMGQSGSISIDKGKSPVKNNNHSLIPETPFNEIPPSSNIQNKSNRRNLISPLIWQETLPLLCESNYSIRITYAKALLLFLETELTRSSIRSQKNKIDSSIYRFCNALNATIYTLAMSNSLGSTGYENDNDISISNSNSNLHTPNPNTNNTNGEYEAESNGGNHTPRNTANTDGTLKGVSFNLISATPSSSTPPPTQNNDFGTLSTNGTTTSGGNTTPTTTGNNGQHRQRRQSNRRPSLPLNRLQSFVQLDSFENVSTPLDFSIVLKILEDLFIIQPIPSLLIGIPMLLSLDKDAGNDLIRRSNDGRSQSWVLERKRAIRELVCQIWDKIGERWGLGDIREIAQSALASLPEPYYIPPLQPWTPTADLELPEPAVSFVPYALEGESSSTPKPILDPEVLLDSLTNSVTVQNATGLDALSLRRKWQAHWSVENAIKDSVERYSSGNIKPEDHHIHNDIANVLMSMNNGSYQSFGNGNGSINRPGSRSIDVGDLREALGGKIEDPTTSTPPSIVSSQYINNQNEDSMIKSLSSRGQSRIVSNTHHHNQNSDVKEVLKDIFKDKKRSSLGGNSNSSSARSNHSHNPHAHRIRTASAGSGLGKSHLSETTNINNSFIPNGHSEVNNLDNNHNNGGEAIQPQSINKVNTVNGINNSNNNLNNNNLNLGQVVS